MLHLEHVSLFRYSEFGSFINNLSTVMGCAVVFAITITAYLFWVRRLNKLLGGTYDDQRKAMKGGVTQQQVDLGWRYIGY
jgi:hypothetical protein